MFAKLAKKSSLRGIHLVAAISAGATAISVWYNSASAFPLALVLVVACSIIMLSVLE